MFCSNCGNKLIDDAKFCNACGTKVVNESVKERKTTYDGEIHKCPNCGDTIDAYETVCEACGYEIRGRKATSVVHELALKLENTDSIEKKEELIRTFYIPNTKEDIYEFFILATSNIKAGGTDIKAWTAKLEQAYQKAELSFNGTQEFERLKLLYKKTQAIGRMNVTFGAFKSIGKCFKSTYTWIVIGVLCFYLFFFSPFGIRSSHDKHIEHLEELTVEVNELIDSGDYDTARIKASQIIDDTDWSSESEEKWDNVRETLLETIDKKEKESKAKK